MILTAHATRINQGMVSPWLNVKGKQLPGHCLWPGTALNCPMVQPLPSPSLCLHCAYASEGFIQLTQSYGTYPYPPPSYLWGCPTLAHPSVAVVTALVTALAGRPPWPA